MLQTTCYLDGERPVHTARTLFFGNALDLGAGHYHFSLATPPPALYMGQDPQNREKRVSGSKTLISHGLEKAV